jgi:hypothetical protein
VTLITIYGSDETTIITFRLDEFRYIAKGENEIKVFFGPIDNPHWVKIAEHEYDRILRLLCMLSGDDDA